VKNIYVIRPFGFNIGNHVIFRGLKQLVTEVFGETINIISIPATNKYNSYGKAGLTQESIYEINQYGDGVIIGGGNILENGEILVDETALKALRPPMMIIGVSWGKIYSQQGQLVPRTDSLSDSKIQALVNSSQIVLVRDEITKLHLDSLSSRDVKVASCPSLFLHKEKPSYFTNNEMVLSIRHPALMSIPPYHQSRVRHDIRELNSFCRSRSIKLRLLCHDHRDISFASSFPECEYYYFEDTEEYLHVIQSAEALVTFRLHSFLPAIVLGTHAVNISYDQRSSSALETLGLTEWDVNYMDDNSAIDTIINRIEHPDELRRILNRETQRHELLKHSQRSGMAEFTSLVETYSNYNSKF